MADPVVTPQPSGDALILGKFKTPEDVYKAYTELEKKLGAPPSTPAAPVVDALNPPAKVGVDGLTIEAVAPPVAGKALDAAYAKFVASEGKLADTDYAALEKSGFTRSDVDTYVQGREAVFTNMKSTIYGIAGSEANYRTMASWMAANVPKAEVDAFNASMKSGNMAAMSLAVSGLKARYTQTVGSEPATIDGASSAPASGVQPYGSRNEFLKDTSSKQYQSDPDFRAQVQKRLAASRQK